MAGLFIIVAVICLVWWLVWTVRVFARIARHLIAAALGVGTIVHLLWKLLSTPRSTLLDDFLARRTARH